MMEGSTRQMLLLDVEDCENWKYLERLSVVQVKMMEAFKPFG